MLREFIESCKRNHREMLREFIERIAIGNAKKFAEKDSKNIKILRV